MTMQNNFVNWAVVLSNGFELALRIIIDEEARTLSTDRQDKGNWTGGQVGVGLFHGSKFGISAASYPNVDIAALTYQDAAAIYRRDFAEPIMFYSLPTILGTIMLDAAVNNGAKQSVKWLQAALNVAQDGDFGPVTASALKQYIKASNGSVLPLCASISHMRLAMMSHLPAWKVEGGWAKRLAYLPYRAVAVLTIPVSTYKGFV